jgi:nicotinamidase-related amidase
MNGTSAPNLNEGMKRTSKPPKSTTCLLLIDVINDLDFVGGDKLLRHAMPAAQNIARLKDRAAKASVPTIYVNDNFGRWRSDFRHQVAHCLEERCLGKKIAGLLLPDKNDYFVLKPKHSGFFSTSLDVLLKHLGARTLILTGFAGISVCSIRQTTPICGTI